MDEGTERKIVFPDDILRFYNVWDEQVKQALPLINSLDQPLKNFIKQKTWKKIMKVVEGREDMQSILSCYYNPEKRIKKLA
jgi:hypothetical protein